MAEIPRLILPEDLPGLGIPYTDKHRRDLEPAGKFPKRVQLSPRRHAYLHSEIMTWIRERIAARDGAEAA
jgi:prophage regulatory protein